jgi:elongation factor Ts
MTTLELIKKLRQETNLSMSLIKETLEKYDLDYEKTKEALKSLIVEHDHTMVGKKGMVYSLLKDHHAVLFEVNAMTDFVKTNDAFVSFVEFLGQTFIQHPDLTIDQVPTLKVNGTTIDDLRKQLETKIQEHIEIRRLTMIHKTKNHVFGRYQHHNHHAVAIAVIEGGNEEVANLVAKQVAALGELHPMWKKTIIDQINQSSLLGSEQTVEAYLNTHQAKLVETHRYQLGEDMNEHLSCSLLQPNSCA